MGLTTIMSDHRILFATDVPFWKMSDGAQQRISSLHRYLASHGHAVHVFYLGKVDEHSRELVTQQSIDLSQITSDQPPKNLLSRLQWYANATINQARQWLMRPSCSLTDEDGPRSLELDDFRWPWAMRRFRETVNLFKPTIIVFEYIKMGYLMDALSEDERASMKCVVDTHDILHRRASQFFENGFPHWLKINREQESKALEPYDLILAIQDKEAQILRSMAPNVETITVGHAVDLPAHAPCSKVENPGGKVRFGYIGSKNFSNWHAIQNFVENAWPAVVDKNSDTCELLVAGGICEWLETGASDHTSTISPESLKNVTLVGRVDEIKEFYAQIDVLINPVEFGTGLKIKNAEALSFGKQLITTTNGFDGMPESSRLACRVVESVSEMGDAINSMLLDPEAIAKMQVLASELAQTEFSERFAYSALSEWLNRQG